MLINNKSLIKTINKLNLTDDEREKFNKISEDDRGNFLYNGKPVTGGATTEQIAQIQANKTAIGDENSGLTKEINDIKNTELQNLNTAIQTLETLVGVDETVGDKTGLPSGDANIIASINRIDRKTTTGNGLTTEQAQHLQTAYEHSQSDHVQASDIPSLNGYATETYTDNAISNALDGHTFKFLTQAEYDALSTEEKTDSTIEYHITDAVESDSLPAYTELDAGKALVVNSDGTNVEWSTASGGESTFDGILTSPSGYKFKLVVSDTGILSTSQIIDYGDIILSCASLSINEGTTGTFTVALSKAPTNEQVVNISVNNSNCSVDIASLTFTSSNYNIAQAVNVTTTHNKSSYENMYSVITLSSDNVDNKIVDITVINIDVETIPVTAVTVTPKTAAINVNKTVQLTSTVTPSNATDTSVTWETSNSNCTVVNGLVTGVATGECVITARSNSNSTISDSSTITVTEAIGSDYATLTLNQYYPYAITGWGTNIEGYTCFELNPNYTWDNFDFSSSDNIINNTALPLKTEAEIKQYSGEAIGYKPDGYIFIRLSNNNASTVEELRTYLQSNSLSLDIKIKDSANYDVFTTSGLTSSDIGLPSWVDAEANGCITFEYVLAESNGIYVVNTMSGCYSTKLTAIYNGVNGTYNKKNTPYNLHVFEWGGKTVVNITLPVSVLPSNDISGVIQHLESVVYTFNVNKKISS